MLDELKDLVEKKIFTVKETKQIIKQRTAFENTLVRRVARKADFLRYAQYEMNLELLRRKRLQRMKLPPGPATVSDYALVRRQFHIFERGLKRFKSDIGLWIEYIQVAQKEGARSLVGRITARALQFHPNTPALYILAASHELNHLSPSTARSLLQRGIRMNPESIEMWKEYVKMELGFIESLRRRWDVLGIHDNKTDKGKEKEKLLDSEIVDEDGDLPMVTTTDDDADVTAFDGQEGTAARKEIMGGIIVKAAISSAVQALPKIELFEALDQLITSYPSPPELRGSVVAHLDELLSASFPDHPRAVKLLCKRVLRPGIVGEQLVDGIKAANTIILSRASESSKEEMLQAYSDFVLEQYHTVLDSNLKLYLISSLQGLIQTQKKSPSLLSAHIRLLTEAAQRGTSDKEKVLLIAKRYTSRVPEAPSVWLARLTAVRDLGEAVEEVWMEARGCVSVSQEETLTVWTWGLSSLPQQRKRQVHEELLRESIGDSGLQGVHEELLMSYVSLLAGQEVPPATEEAADHNLGVTNDSKSHAESWKRGIRYMQRTCFPSGRVWQQAFMRSKQGCVGEDMLRDIYECWRRGEEEDATVEWARWLLENGKGKAATDVILRSNNRAVEERWRRLVAAG
ncbi:hypothetical protein E1B28_009970 [Marasmius oreades]|nr:uncharacterized protein E1B28_009970 [Marasmius oreades]KAG7090891.1 hypothetical protein E1B28_009970 [Marasmius oreades]